MKNKMFEEQKFVLLQNNYTVSYTENNCFVNGKEESNEQNNNMKPIEIAEALKLNFYKSFLKQHFKNVVILTAAGTSIDNGDNNGKSRDGLWDYCKVEIEMLKKYFKDSEYLEQIMNYCATKDIESLLSYLIIYEKIHKVIEYENKYIKKEIEKKIAEACKLTLSLLSPHTVFLRKMLARKNNDSRIQLFTTNYDTLFEQAASKAGFIIIDGFSFTHPREFSGKWFDLDIVNRDKTRLKQEESFLPEVFHLYKLHGSLNWLRTSDNKIIQNDNPSVPLIIYPANEKYESSYEQPYFEMMSRFQQALRKENSLLIIIGFGFQDKHLNNVIFEAIEQNPSFQLLIINYNNTKGIDTNYLLPFFYDKDNKIVKHGVNIVFDTFQNFTNNIPENLSYSSKSGVINDSI